MNVSSLVLEVVPIEATYIFAVPDSASPSFVNIHTVSMPKRQANLTVVASELPAGELISRIIRLTINVAFAVSEGTMGLVSAKIMSTPSQRCQARHTASASYAVPEWATGTVVFPCKDILLSTDGTTAGAPVNCHVPQGAYFGNNYSVVVDGQAGQSIVAQGTLHFTAPPGVGLGNLVSALYFTLRLSLQPSSLLLSCFYHSTNGD